MWRAFSTTWSMVMLKKNNHELRNMLMKAKDFLNDAYMAAYRDDLKELEFKIGMAKMELINIDLELEYQKNKKGTSNVPNG